MKKEKIIKEIKEVIVPPKPKVTLVSYSIKMVIPTGNYANIQPEIIVKAGTAEDAHNYIAPHMNKLWKEYYLINDRPVNQPKPNVPVTTAQSTLTVAPTIAVTPPEEMSPIEAVAFNKASQAIASCLSQDALDLISAQIGKSVKLSGVEKDKLMVLVINKIKELDAKNLPE